MGDSFCFDIGETKYFHLLHFGNELCLDFGCYFEPENGY